MTSETRNAPQLAGRTVAIIATGNGQLIAREGCLRTAPEAVRYWLLDSSGASIAHRGTWQTAPLWLKMTLGNMRREVGE